MVSFYTELTESRSGLLIPISNTSSLCSRYDPVKEGETFASSFNDDQLFFVIGGFCGGYHIESLLNRNPLRKIIVVEESQDDFNFLENIPCCKKLMNDNRVICTTFENLYLTIISNYLPALYGNLNVAFVRAWENLKIQSIQVLKNVIELAISNVKADYSVQSNFGKIWQKNIFSNLSMTGKAKAFNDIFPLLNKAALQGKTAAIIAAGPGLENRLKELKDSKYFIISTDTAYSTLRKHKITPQAVVSIDGQFVSHTHFFDCKNNENTIFFFDLCACSSAAKKLMENSLSVCYFETGHPLAVTASCYTRGKSFIHLEAGTGTVTITAADLARKCGFKSIEFFGADFAYTKRKPYTKGTYLDSNFGIVQKRTDSLETRFNRLIFRTETQSVKDGWTTSLMQSYRENLDFYLKRVPEPVCMPEESFNYNNFCKWYEKSINELPEQFTTEISTPVFYTLLPLMAWFEKKNPKENSFVLARTNSLRYNKLS